LTADTVTAYGVTGPAARSAGVDVDLRRQRPYLAYGELITELDAAAEHRVHPEADGSVPARFAMLADELVQSATLIRTCVRRLQTLTGPVAVRLGKIVKLPEGEIYLATEAPLGQAGCYLVSRGEKTPWRLKLRTPSFNNVAALEALLVGTRMGDLELLLASMGYVVGDIDK
jgi:NADH-quinone oxidoreductase subunit D